MSKKYQGNLWMPWCPWQFITDILSIALQSVPQMTKMCKNNVWIFILHRQMAYKRKTQGLWSLSRFLGIFEQISSHFALCLPSDLFLLYQIEQITESNLSVCNGAWLWFWWKLPLRSLGRVRTSLQPFPIGRYWKWKDNEVLAHAKCLLHCVIFFCDRATWLGYDKTFICG